MQSPGPVARSRSEMGANAKGDPKQDLLENGGVLLAAPIAATNIPTISRAVGVGPWPSKPVKEVRARR